MKGKRLLILGAAFALGLSACANSATMVRKAPQKLGTDTTKYSLINDVSDLEAGKSYIITNNENSGAVKAMSVVDNANNRKGTDGTVSDGKITRGSGILSLTLGGSTGAWTFATENYEGTAGYLNATNTTGSNYLKVVAGDDAYNKFTISFSNNNAVITCTGKSSHNLLRYNSSANNGNLFACYTSGQSAICLWKEVESSSPTISLNKASLGLEVGDDFELVASLSGGASGSITWKSSNPSSVSVSSSGLVHAYAVGSATITAFIDANNNGLVDGNELSASCEVVVEAATNFGSEENPLNVTEAIAVIDKYKPSRTKKPLFINGTISEASYSTQYSNYTVWLQSDDGEEAKAFELYALVIDANEFGDFSENASALVGYKITATGYGEFHTNNSAYELTYVTVDNVRVDPTALSLVAPEFIILNPTELTLEVGEEQQLFATIPDGATNVVWASDDESVAEVDQQGNVSAIATGSASISVSADGLNPVSCEITVEPATNFGSEEHPLNIADAITAINRYPELTKKIMFVKGKISSASYDTTHKNYTVWLQSDDGSVAQAFELYALVIDADEFGNFSEDPSELAGYEITATGYGKHYTGNNKSIYELFNASINGNIVYPTTIALKAPSLTPNQQISKLNSRSALSYSYVKNTSYTSTITDVLNRGVTGVTGTSYTVWSGKTVNSDAVYAGQSAGGNSSIQLRATSPSGVITTTSGGIAKSITVSWNSNTANGRVLDVYGSNSAYEGSADLYDDAKAGTLLGTIVYGTSTSLVIDGEYTYIGLKSASGAMYLTNVSIEWTVESDVPTVDYDYSNVAIRFGGFLSKALWDDLDTASDIQGYGVKLSTTDGVDEDFYTALSETKLNPALASASQKAQQKVENAEDPYYVWNLYVTIGDAELKREFSAAAYIKLGNDEIVYFKTVTFSAKTLAGSLIENGVYASDAFDGSLANLANLQ